MNWPLDKLITRWVDPYINWSIDELSNRSFDQ